MGSHAPASSAGPAAGGAGDGADREARWQQVCSDAGAAYAAPDPAETAGPGLRAREHLLHRRVDRAGTAKHRWLATELVLQGRCADTGVPYAAPADGETANSRRHRHVKLRQLVGARTGGDDAAAWAKLERECRAVGARCSQLAAYADPTDPALGLTTLEQKRAGEKKHKGNARSRKRRDAQATKLARVSATADAADNGAGGLDAAYRLHVAVKRPPGLEQDDGNSMSDSDELQLGSHRGHGRSGAACDTPRRRRRIALSRDARDRRRRRAVHQQTVDFQVNECGSKPVACECCRNVRIWQQCPFGSGGRGACTAAERLSAPTWNPMPRRHLIGKVPGLTVPCGRAPVMCKQCAEKPEMWCPDNMLLPIPGDWVKGMAHGAGSPPFVANTTYDEESVVGPAQVVVQVRGGGHGGVTTSGHVAVAMRDTGALLSLVPRLPGEVNAILMQRRVPNGRGGRRQLPTLLVRKRPMLEFVLGNKHGVIASWVDPGDGERHHVFGPPDAPGGARRPAARRPGRSGHRRRPHVGLVGRHMG